MKPAPQFDAWQPWDSAQEAIDAIYEQPRPDEAAWAVIHRNVEMGEIGFARDLLYEYFNTAQPA